MFKKECPDCKGTKKCECGGVGCSKCCEAQDGATKQWHGKNKGKCPTCKGTGKVTP